MSLLVDEMGERGSDGAVAKPEIILDIRVGVEGLQVGDVLDRDIGQMKRPSSGS
ncbi:hypothetical protein [Hyphomicrobium sp. ghe19]|uniref:hypothetical protein n=1 Tax=Hyphomicrobium sp. ghe19 TaxID=2682968 RepID=UPI0013675E94|nr:hypothetical protein HYPP_03208 [Hyphomicrobium sp. ghe19]